jgi:fibro-slime domain-containing protein
MPCRSDWTTVATYAVLATTCTVTLTLPQTLTVPHVAAYTDPDVVTIVGTVRDFHHDHPDFDVVPAGGYGHFAGTVSLTPGAGSRPVLAAVGLANPDLLFVTRDGASLIGHEAAKKALFESWGYAVTLVADDAPAAEYATKLASADVVYIGSDVVHGNIAPRVTSHLKPATAGIVNEEKFITGARPATLAPGLGLAYTGADCYTADFSTTDVDVVSATHWITQDAGTGLEPLFLSGESMYGFTGGVAPGATVLAERAASSNVMIIAIDAGGALAGGGTASGRRATFPAAWTTGPAALTAQGTDLLRRIVAWAAGNDGPGTGGFRVVTQWRDTDANAIPPHLAREPFTSPPTDSQVEVVSGPTIIDSGSVDTYDSGLGPYGGGNVGPAPTFVPGSPMPPVSPPTGMPPRVDSILYDGGTHTLAADRYCKDFVMQNGALLRISGDVRILADEKFIVQNGASIELLAGATLTLWVRKVCTFQDDCNANTADPSRFTIYNLGTDPVIVQNAAQLYATVISPGAPLHIQDDGDFYGSFTGLSVHIQNSGALHIDVSGGPPEPVVLCGTQVNDAFGAAGAAGTGGVTSAATFDEWFTDVLGTNLAKPHAITLTNDGTGVYEYMDAAFFPIDDALYGNEGNAHNFHFTYAFEFDFAFAACAGQFLEFEGADNAWFFVDGKLGLDLGGMLPGTPQRVDIDRLDLVDGVTYTLSFFYAQRNGTTSVFRVRTNLPIEGDMAPVSVTAAFD